MLHAFVFHVVVFHDFAVGTRLCGRLCVTVCVQVGVAERAHTGAQAWKSDTALSLSV